MTKKISRTIGLIMLLVAVVFLLFALTHPNGSFPWSGGITMGLYLVYVLGMVLLLIAPFRRK